MNQKSNSCFDGEYSGLIKTKNTFSKDNYYRRC